MKVLAGALLTMWIGSVALADSRTPPRVEASSGAQTAETLKQLERDWAVAQQSGDRAEVSRIVADDWTGFDSDGGKLTKEQLLERLKSAKSKTASVQFGPMDVKVLGDVAVVQGSEIETGATNGQYASGQEIWMDVFANRNGKWVAVRSQTTRAGTVSRPRWPI